MFVPNAVKARPTIDLLVDAPGNNAWLVCQTLREFLNNLPETVVAMPIMPVNILVYDVHSVLVRCRESSNFPVNNCYH
jgi:hypothetical protein